MIKDRVPIESDLGSLFIYEIVIESFGRFPNGKISTALGVGGEICGQILSVTLRSYEAQVNLVVVFVKNGASNKLDVTDIKRSKDDIFFEIKMVDLNDFLGVGVFVTERGAVFTFRKQLFVGDGRFEVKAQRFVLVVVEILDIYVQGEVTANLFGVSVEIYPLRVFETEADLIVLVYLPVGGFV